LIVGASRSKGGTHHDSIGSIGFREKRFAANEALNAEKEKTRVGAAVKRERDSRE